MEINSIPQEMRLLDQWVCWRFEDRGGTKKTKVPIDAKTCKLASVTDWSTWSSFAQALDTFGQGQVDGIGFVLSLADPFCFVDLDSTEDPEELAIQIEISNSIHSYQEISPSGGLHILCKGSVPCGRRKGKIEIYSSNRYLTMTGKAWKDCEITFQQAKISQIWESLGPGNGEVVRTRYDGNSPQLEDDQTVINRASGAANGAKFCELWHGNFGKYYSSQSEADLALMNMLAFWTQNREQIARLFRFSALGQRQKASRDGYVNNMIEKAFDQVVPPIDLSAIQNQIRQYQNENHVKPVRMELPNHPHTLPPPAPIRKVAVKESDPSIYTVPPGLMGQIAQWIYQSAPRPVPQIALAGAIGLMAGICGRSYNVSSTGLNQYVMLLGNTGVGKEAISSGISRLIDIIRFQMPQIVDFIGPSDLASGQGLIKCLSDHPTKSLVSIMGEFGIRLQQISNPKAIGADSMLKRVLLDLFNKSGRGNVVRSTAYSDSEKNTKSIESPAYSIIGESVPEKFYSAIDEDMISSGLLPRFLVIEYLGKRPELNEAHNTFYPSQELVQGICNLATQSLQLINTRNVIDVGFSPEALEFLRVLNLECDEKINSSSADVVRNLWNRCHIKTMKLAALVAVGVNPYSPVIDLESAQWAERIVREDIERISERFHSGRIGDGGCESEQMREVLRVITDYITTPYEQLSTAGGRVNFAMHENFIVPYFFISRRLINTKLFRKDPMGATRAIKKAIGNLVDNSDVARLPPTQVLSTYGFSGESYVLVNMEILENAKRMRLNQSSG
jgi:hypothetical protein